MHESVLFLDQSKGNNEVISGEIISRWLPPDRVIWVSHHAAALLTGESLISIRIHHEDHYVEI